MGNHWLAGDLLCGGGWWAWACFDLLMVASWRASESGCWGRDRTALGSRIGMCARR